MTALLALSPVCADPAGPFSPPERTAILAHGPWPQPRPSDTSNRWADSVAAAALGRRLFVDPRLSANARVACASCHQPALHFQDGRQVGQGLSRGTRNTPSLLDVAGRRWYGWDGASDSLWAASLRAMLAPHEMAFSAAAAAALVRDDADLQAGYRAAFGPPAAAGDEQVLVHLAKALAAYQRTLVSPPTAFDRLRDAVARGDTQAAAAYPAAAMRGLRLFVGEARCHLCHAGPAFTNGEFADTGHPHFLPGGGVDPGRHGGLQALHANRFNRLGPYADDAGRDAVATRHVRMTHRNFGEFKVPTLRGLAHTAPYMHDGSLPTLAAVLAHYNELDEDRLHADGERILRPLRFNQGQLDDLEAFLLTLSTRATASPP